MVQDDQGQEQVVLGKGVGFGLKKGDKIDESKIERRFTATSHQDEVNQVKEINASTIDLTNKVIQMVEPLLNVKFNDFQYLALADHIDFALSRTEDHIDMSAANTRWEVKNLFPKEYKISERVIALINKEMKVNLPPSESIFMTYHFVNAASDNDQVQETVEITELISGIIDIIQYQYQMTLDTESFNYSRFITHLRVLLVRLLRNKHQKSGELDDSLLAFMKIKYNHAYDTAERIATYLHSKKGWTLNSDDKFYLVFE
ncbi:putative transcription antiterminator LicT [Lactobacillus gasseri SV-16A-US]|uniref:PRD domain protein n=2 Tax=Lactobacillus gasseri TaxID=1596 RepID=D1YLM4_LACGS|nr:PRD domain protein [Lactobacillus gasseri 224-1]KFL96547.1 putative transcription antiterminator LicT [Lactobacillus gasseri SV-16A-US]